MSFYRSISTQLGIVGFLLVFALLPQSAWGQAAQNDDCEQSKFGCFEVGLPDSGISAGRTIDSFIGSNKGAPIVAFIVTVVNYVTVLIVAVALMITVVAGYQYMTAGGSGNQVSDAKDRIGKALLGVIVALAAYLILNTISPQFTPNKDPVFGNICSSNTDCDTGYSCVQGKCVK